MSLSLEPKYRRQADMQFCFPLKLSDKKMGIFVFRMKNIERQQSIGELKSLGLR